MNVVNPSGPPGHPDPDTDIDTATNGPSSAELPDAPAAVAVIEDDSYYLTRNTVVKKEARMIKKSLYPERFPYNRLHPKEGEFEIVKKDAVSNYGVISYRSIKQGDVVAAITGDVVHDIRQHTLQIRPGAHLYDTWFSGYFLHSCSPNVYLDMENRMVYALRDIAPSDYLYMDYAQTEDELFKCFPCSCGSDNCRSWITGRMQAPDPSDALYQQYLASNSSSTNLAPAPAPAPWWRWSGCWWEREDLAYQRNRLIFAGQDVANLAKRHGTPSFVYNGQRILDNIDRLRSALHKAGFENRSRVLYAMKANRFAPLLTFLKMSGKVGIDACSPNEVEHAISCGFHPQDISFTNTSLSRQDLVRLSNIDNLNMNCDSLHAIRRWGELAPGSAIGIRINPAMGIGRPDNDKLQYCGVNISKFGIYKEQLAEALAIAKEYKLRITRVHFHTGCGYLTPQLDHWSSILQECLGFIDQIGTVETLNIGGGLGVPYVANDRPLDLDKWGSILAKHFLHRNIHIEVEPGAYIVQDAGILLLTVNSIETKQAKTFVGVNGGFNIALEPAVYSLPFQPVPALRKPGVHQQVTLAGHINEALDIWYKDVDLPPLAEDDVLALINAGAYSSSMASNHCMRGEFKEFLLM